MQAVLKTAGTQFFHSGFALPLQLGIAGAKLIFFMGRGTGWDCIVLH